MTTLQQAQTMHDRAAPEDHPRWLDTTAGANWLDSAVDDLFCGRPLKIGRNIVLDKFQIADRLAELFLAALKEGRDEDENFGMLLFCAAAGGDAERYFNAIMGRNYLEQLTREMVEPFADMACKQMMEDAEDDC